MNKDQVLFWLKGYMESMLQDYPPIGVVDDLRKMLGEINKAIPEDKQEKKLLTDNKTAPNAEWETIKKNASRRVYPGDGYITHIS